MKNKYFIWIIGAVIYGAIHTIPKRIFTDSTPADVIVLILEAVFWSCVILWLNRKKLTIKYGLTLKFSQVYVIDFILLLIPAIQLCYSHFTFSLIFTLSTLTAVFAEEFIFRSVIPSFLCDLIRIRVVSSGIISSLLFAVFHLVNISSVAPKIIIIQCLYAFFAGLGLFFLRNRSNSVISCVIVHFLINVTSSEELCEGYLPASIFSVIFAIYTFYGFYEFKRSTTE